MYWVEGKSVCAVSFKSTDKSNLEAWALHLINNTGDKIEFGVN